MADNEIKLKIKLESVKREAKDGDKGEHLNKLKQRLGNPLDLSAMGTGTPSNKTEQPEFFSKPESTPEASDEEKQNEPPGGLAPIDEQTGGDQQGENAPEGGGQDTEGQQAPSGEENTGGKQAQGGEGSSNQAGHGPEDEEQRNARLFRQQQAVKRAEKVAPKGQELSAASKITGASIKDLAFASSPWVRVLIFCKRHWMLVCLVFGMLLILLWALFIIIFSPCLQLSLFTSWTVWEKAGAWIANNVCKI